MKLSRYLIILFAFLLPLLNSGVASAASLPCDPGHLSQCPKPGRYTAWWHTREIPVIYSDADLKLLWPFSVVEKPPAGQVPQWFKVDALAAASRARWQSSRCPFVWAA